MFNPLLIKSYKFLSIKWAAIFTLITFSGFTYGSWLDAQHRDQNTSSHQSALAYTAVKDSIR